jgi:hypothetical protein
MKSCVRLLFVVSAFLPLASCDKPLPPAAAAPVAAETDNQLAEARDALQRQALEIETKTALMDKQLAEMAQSLKERDNAELRDSLDALKRQNEALRVQADAARQQSNAITQRIAVAPPQNVAKQPMALPDYSLFYDRLEPYGRWFEVNGYGYCWRPTITVAGWRPYVDGCWVWSSYGWAWQTNEPFGWATYHYGRWVNLARYGWIWVPGSDWAPAWVAWRQSRDCVGWAPLPPEPGAFSGVYRDCDSRYGLGPNSYTFINTNQFVSSSYINVYAPVTRQTTIFQHSVNVTQIVPSRGQGHAFTHHGGPPRTQIEQACGRPVPQRQVQTMHAAQMPAHPQHHWRRDATAPVAMVELPAVAPGSHVSRPDVKEHIQRPVRTSGFDGVSQRVATEIRETLAREKETAQVQQPPANGHMPHQAGQPSGEAPAVVNGEPRVPNAPQQETVSSASAPENQAPAQVVAPAGQHRPGQGNMPHPFPRHAVEAPVAASMPPVTDAPAQETVRPAVAAEPNSGAARESRNQERPTKGTPRTPEMPPESKVVESSVPAVAPAAPSDVPGMVVNKAAEPAAAAVVPVSEPERTALAVVTAPPAVMPQTPADPSTAQQPVAAEKMAADQVTAAASAEAQRVQMRADREQARAAAMEQRQQEGLQERGMAEKRAAEQAAANGEVEKNRMQAAASQQEAQAAQQQRMAAEQAAAEAEKARQQAAAAQQQQDMAAQQQRATAERMAAEQAAVVEAERVRQQTEAVAMQQRQQEEVTRRAAEEQQMRAQQEAAQRAQEMAQRQAEEQVRRQQEAEMQRAQEQARRAAEEQQMRAQQEAAQRAQEMAQRQAEEQARRQQEAEMQRAQEQARRAAEEQQMRAQQEAAQRAQEMAQRQAEEQARRAQEMAQRQAEEQARRAQEEAQRAAAEAARNQPQPAPGS